MRDACRAGGSAASTVGTSAIATITSTSATGIAEVVALGEVGARDREDVRRHQRDGHSDQHTQHGEEAGLEHEHASHRRGWNPSERSTPTSRLRSRTARYMITPTPAIPTRSPAPTNCCISVKNPLLCDCAAETMLRTVCTSAPLATNADRNRRTR